MAAIADYFQSLLSRGELSWLRRVPPWALAAGATGSLMLSVAAWKDYRIYLSYGPGGLPYNPFGWFVTACILRPLGREVLSTKKYDDKANKQEWLPKDWPKEARIGERPILGPHPLPQRQLTQLTTPWLKKKTEDAFESLVQANSQLVKLQQSVHEGHTEAMFLVDRSNESAIAKQMLGEVSHIHATGDHSIHVVLSPQDCKKVIESGWGQRHPLDGVQAAKYIFGWTIPDEYILLYAPRSEHEIDVAMEIVAACIGFMTGSRNVVKLQSKSS